MGKKAPSKPRTYVFTLEDIDLRAINTKYSISTLDKGEVDCVDSDYRDSDIGKSNTTRLADLNTEKGTPEVI